MSRSALLLPAKELLNARFLYCPKTGNVRWKISRSNIKAGVIDEITSFASNGNIAMSKDSARWKPPTNIQWDMGSYETVTLVYGEKTLVLKTKDIFDALSEK